MIAKCICLYCQQPIEFELSEFSKISFDSLRDYGQHITCPGCGKTTQLYTDRVFAGPPPEKFTRHTAPVAKAGVGKLTACGDCGGRVSRRAETCPHCGAPRSGIAATITGKVFLAILLASFVIGLVAALLGSSSRY